MTTTAVISDPIGSWFTQSDHTVSTEATYRLVLDEFIARHADPFSVSERDVADFVLLDAEGRRRTVSGNSLRRNRTALAAFYRWAFEHRHVAVDYRPALKALDLPCRRVRLGRWLTKGEAARLLGVCDQSPRGVRDRALLGTALLTGLRAAELVGLTWGDVFMDQGRIQLVGKGRKLAEVAIPAQALEALKAWRDLVETSTRTPVDSTAPVFCASSYVGGLKGATKDYRFNWAKTASTALTRSVLAHRANQAGIGHVAPHDLRRSFAGFLDDRGIDLRTIQTALRHSSADTTVRCYLTPNPTRALRAVAALEL